MERLKTLADIFGSYNKQFLIPDYQRGYSWETRHRNDLWEDINNITDNKRHYTGMFTFCITQQNNCKIYEVVDGQQRMTTLIILLNEILARIEPKTLDDDTVPHDDYIKNYLYRTNGLQRYQYKFQYDKKDPSYDYFTTKILGIKNPTAQIQNTLYTRNLQNAKDEFAEKLRDATQDQLKMLLHKITEQLVFNEYVIDDAADVYVTFETMNNRGKSLSTLELLKNRLIYLTTIYPEARLSLEDAQDLRQKINDAWKKIYQHLGKNANKALGDDEFLKDHWIMYFRYDRKTSMVYKEDLLSREFTARKVFDKDKTLEPSDIYEYVNSLAESVEIWYQIKCPNDINTLPEAEKVLLTRLDRVGIGSFRPMLMAAYLTKGHEDIEPLLDACERFRFLIRHISGRRSNTADSVFYGLAQKCFKGEKTITNLITDVNNQTIGWFDFDNFVKACVDRYKNEEGFYSWKGGLQYFLFEYERSKQMRNKMLCDWDTIVHTQEGKISIEHIYPQTDSEQYWKLRFPDNHLLNSLGNLLLLKSAKNSHLQNDSFDKKKKTTFDTNHDIVYLGYDYGSYSEQIVSQYSEWTPNAIIERGKVLLNFLVEHWGIDEINKDSYKDKSVLTEDNVNKILNIHPTPNIQNSTIVIESDVNDDEYYDEEDMEIQND